jgi:hypothetical protein
MSAVESDVPVAGSCPGSVVALAALVGDTAAVVGETGAVVPAPAVVVGPTVVVGAMVVVGPTVVVGAVVGVCSVVTVRLSDADELGLALSVHSTAIVKLPSTLKVTGNVNGKVCEAKEGGFAAMGSGGSLLIVPSTNPTGSGQVTVTFTARPTVGVSSSTVIVGAVVWAATGEATSIGTSSSGATQRRRGTRGVSRRGQGPSCMLAWRLLWSADARQSSQLPWGCT